MSFSLRPARDDDAGAVIAVVSGCWDEYPGCVTDIDGEAPELRAPASHMAAKGGAAWVVEADGAVAGVCAVWPAGEGAWELGKMYVAAGARGTGAARALADTAERHASDAGAAEMRLFSDTRFDRAHAFYEKRSYVRHGALRALGDKSHSIEFGYTKPLTGVVVRALDVAALDSATHRLSAILCACVDGGASVSFLPPLSLETARAFWRRGVGAVAAGRRIVLAAWAAGELAGTVTLDCETPDNQPHRADVAKLLVHPAARRHGIARALMRHAEAAAREAGRSLLTLDTCEGGAAESLYRAMGWVRAGSIPGYAIHADGTPCDTVLFYKQLADASA